MPRQVFKKWYRSLNAPRSEIDRSNKNKPILLSTKSLEIGVIMQLDQLQDLKLGQRVCTTGVSEVFHVMILPDRLGPLSVQVVRMAKMGKDEVGKWVMGSGANPIQCFSVVRKGQEIRRLEGGDKSMFVVSKVFSDVCAVLTDCRMIEESNVGDWYLEPL